MFKAIYLTQDEEKNVTANLSDVDEADLPDHNVAIDVEYSTINYKDGLAIMGKPSCAQLSHDPWYLTSWNRYCKR